MVVVGTGIVVVGWGTVVLGAGATCGAPDDAEVATPYPMMATSAAAATGPIQRGPPASSMVWLGARSPKGLLSSSMISMISMIPGASSVLIGATMPGLRRQGR